MHLLFDPSNKKDSVNNFKKAALEMLKPDKARTVFVKSS
jgi:hypothetical protein